MSSIDFVTNPYSGGGPRNIYTLSRLLKERGYNSNVCFFNEVNHQKMSPKLVQQFNISVKYPDNFFGTMNMILSRTDSLKLPLFPAFLFEEYVTRVAVLKRHSPPDAYISTFWQSVIPSTIISNKRNKHHFYFVQANEVGFSNNRIYRKYADKSYKIDIPRFTHSMWVKEFLDKTYGGENEYIGMGVNTNAFHKRNINRQQIIFTIARREFDKGFDVFAKALNLLYEKRKNFKVIIAGESEAVTKLSVSGDLRFPYDFIGWIRNDNELAAMYERSIFVNTGRFEALPMPPLEAMLSGSSVVMTNMPGSLEYTRDGKNVLLCPINDFVCLANKIEDLLDSDTLRSTLSKEAALLSKNYNWKQVLDRLDNFLKKHGLSGME